jgi:hypothetical protein
MKLTTAPRSHTLLAPRQDNRLTGVCPLCHGAAAADVAIHLAGEEDEVAEPTFSIIKALHAGWLEEDGTCAECWNFYRNLVRVLNVAGSFDARFQLHGRNGQSAGI